MNDKHFDEDILNTIVDNGTYPLFMTGGDSDVEGYQIFTPDFVCNDMFKMIGMKNIEDIHQTVLEPSSGDGAFTVRILELRLKSLIDSPNYFHDSLVALSTIFSIEMDHDLIVKQRNNIYTLLMLYARGKGNIPEGYELIAKQIIVTNFIWGETNIDFSLKHFDDPVGWYMPTTGNSGTIKSDKNKIHFARWIINESIAESSYVLEDWEKDSECEDFSSLGGLFANVQ